MKRTSRLPILSALTVVVVVCTPAGSAFADAVPYFAGWDVSGDTANWRRNTSVSSIAVVDTGGNPGGYLFTSGTASGTSDIGALANEFLVPDVTGDYSGTPWVVSFDLLFISGNFDNAWLRFRFSAFTNGWRLPLTNSFPVGQWLHFTATFDPAWSDSEAVAAGWERESNSPSWSQTMSDVYTTEIRISAEGFAEAGIDNFSLVPVTEVDIDIKPGSDPNCFNINGNGVIPVAILGSDTFDVFQINQSSLLFAGLEVRIRGNKGPLCSFGDSNADGFADLVCHFEDDASAWNPGTSEASLEGELMDGTDFQGSDSICVVP
jgi:hypothetical protein